MEKHQADPARLTPDEQGKAIGSAEDPSLSLVLTVLEGTKDDDALTRIGQTREDIDGTILNQKAVPLPDAAPSPFDFLAHLYRQLAFSERTFGPGARTAGVIDHIRKELREIEEHPHDLREWIDVVILGLDGAWRAGYTPEDIIGTLISKQAANELRAWPDWRTAPADKAIEHVRSPLLASSPGKEPT